MNGFNEIYKMQHDLNIMIGRDTINDPEKEKWLFDFTVALGDEIQELQNCTNWKWWAEEGREDQFNKIIDKANAKIEAIDALHFLMSIFQILDITPDDVIKIYKKKHEKNVLRQKNGYSVLNKTEDDNDEIKRGL